MDDRLGMDCVREKVVQTTYEYDQYGNIITIRTNDGLVGSFEYAYDQIRNGTGRTAPTCRYIPRAYTESRSFPSALRGLLLLRARWRLGRF